MNRRKLSRWAWDRIVTHPGFRAGFTHVREGKDWEPRKAKHGRDWWGWYEFGRLFAASEHSRPWMHMPGDRREYSRELNRAMLAAYYSDAFPPADGDWRRG